MILLFQIIYDILQLRRQRCLEKHCTPIGVIEAELPGMQKLPIQTCNHLPKMQIGDRFRPAGTAVEGVTNDRTLCSRQMHPDLMGPPGFQTQVNKGPRQCVMA